MFESTRRFLGRMLCLMAVLCAAALSSADVATFNVTNLSQTLNAAFPLFSIPNNTNLWTMSDLGTHSFTFYGYVSSTNGPETGVQISFAGLDIGTYSTSFASGNPANLQIGGSAPGTPLINGTANIVGLDISLMSSGITVTVPTTTAPGTYSGNITFSMALGSGTPPPNVVLAYTYVVPVPPTSISTIAASPNPVIGGIGSTGTVTLTAAAPAGGWPVTLSSNSTYVSVPASVTVAQGATTATFPITTTQPPATFTGTITGNATSSTKSGTLRVYGNYITGLSLNPTSVLGGASSTGTVTVYLPGSTSGWTVNLSTQYASVKVPATVNVPTGQTTATFTITTSASTVSTTCGIYATDGTSARSAVLGLQGDSLASLSISPSSIGPNQSATATVTLTSPAPASGWTVNIKDQYPSTVSVPSSITIPAGSTTASFSITSKPVVQASLPCGVYISDALSGKNGSVTILGDSMSSLALSPSTVTSGGSSTGTLTLVGPAPAGGWTVNLHDEYPSTVTVPSSVTVPEGSSTATFTITTKKVTNASLICGVYSTDGVVGKNVNLTLQGDSLQSLVISPNSVVGGTSTTGTVTLNGPAPAGGWVVQLSTEYPSVLGVPATVTVPAGTSSTTFTLTTKTTTQTYTAGVYSTDGVSGKNTTVTVTVS